MAKITLLNLRNRARARANMENSGFVTDPEFDSYINYAVTELRDILTSKVGEDYFATSHSVTLTTGQETVPLPTDFYKLLWVEVKAEDGYYYKVRRFEISEQPVTLYSLVRPSIEIKYRLRANDLWIMPASNAGGKELRLWYVPLHQELTNPTDELNGYNGWDEFVILSAARKALVKEEQDVTDIDRELLMIHQRLESMTPNRDQSNPMRIQDNERLRESEWH